MTDRTAAERARRRRDRIRNGKIRLAFEVDEVSHVEMLIETGFLSHLMADDREAIIDATRRLNERLTAVHVERHA